MRVECVEIKSASYEMHKWPDWSDWVLKEHVNPTSEIESNNIILLSHLIDIFICRKKKSSAISLMVKYGAKDPVSMALSDRLRALSSNGNRKILTVDILKHDIYHRSPDEPSWYKDPRICSFFFFFFFFFTRKISIRSFY